MLLLILVALRLLTLNAVHTQTLAGYEAGDKARTLTWGERQGWVNVVERFRAPFAVGDAHVLSGHFGLARPWFEQAFELVPKGGVEECRVRVNLGLTYEALGDEARAKERTEEWRQFYEKGLTITRERPPLCDAPEGGETGQQLADAEQRMEEKNEVQPAPEGGQPQPEQPQPTPQPTPTPDPDKAPSQEQQDALREQQRQSTIERNQRRGSDDRVEPEGGVGTYPRPW
ncbi:hypothetical protein [Intrasporangium sp.]|uniref:hypothetical protein n=1 Tax=Intrasporangium sp. TaxID=1925024 RepID=UPI00293996EE|nr:hypothetical protein [Intrasporangium sp.]MDV3220897.1 hypothetical protein [Intrasporangium sp.]